jgi:FliI/YscN family ATPase
MKWMQAAGSETSRLETALAGMAVETLLGRPSGRVAAVKGGAVLASLGGARVGDMVEIGARGHTVKGEVVGFDGKYATCMLLGSSAGLLPGAPARSNGASLSVPCGEGLLGRVLDGLGVPIDGQPLNRHEAAMVPVDRAPPPPLERRPIKDVFETGIRAIDGLLTIGRGQRLGLFAGSGVGKSTLLGRIARHARADVNVICLVGERGREVGEFIEGSLGPEGLRRSVVVCSTSDRPPLERIKAAFVATAIAEYFRDRGRDVLLMMDSLTRLARAQREVGLASGEPPARQGYPPSVFRLLPEILERAGNSSRGTLTGIYTVLVSGGDFDEPVADEARGILDGHVVLSRELAQRNHYPAIDICASVSRLMPAVASPEHRVAAGRVRSLLGRYEANRDLVSIGAYKPGLDPLLDEAVELNGSICGFLSQGDDPSSMTDTLKALEGLTQ